MRTFLKPEGNVLHFLVRAPMNALRGDMDVPLQDVGNFLDLTNIEPALRDAAQVWIRDFVKIYENGNLLPLPTFVAARVTLPGDVQSFSTYERAVEHLQSQLAPETDIVWEQGMLDIAYEYPIQSEDSQFSIDPGLTRLGLEVNIALRFISPEGVERSYDVHPYVGRVELDPNVGQAAYFFAKEGFFQLLGSLEALLLLAALAIPFRRLQDVVIVTASFVVSHSVTLIAAGFGLAPNTLWFPYFTSLMVAVAILYFTLENIIGAKVERRVWFSLAFGLFFGFSFAWALGDRLQFSGSHLVTSVISYNVGIELGLVVAIAIIFTAMAILTRYVAPERMAIIILSAFIAHTAWDWTLERAGMVSRFSFPTVDALIHSGVLWWLTAALGLGAILWLVSGIVPGLQPSRASASAPPREQ